MQLLLSGEILPAAKAVRIKCFEIQAKRRYMSLHEFGYKMTGEWSQ